MSKHAKNKDKKPSPGISGTNTLAVILDKQGRIKFVTKKLASLMGYATNELLGKEVFDYIADSEKEDRRSQLDFLYKQESVIKAFDLVLITKNNEPVKFRFSIVKLEAKDGNEEDIAFIGDNLKVTQKVVTKLQSDESQLTEIIDSAKEFILIIDSNEKVKSINEVGQNKLGIKPGMIFSDLLEPSAIKHTKAFLNSISNISSVANVNLVLVHPETKQRFYLNGTVSILVEKKKVLEFRMILHDVSEQVKTEKAKDLYYSIAHHSIHSKNLNELYYNIHKELKQVVDCENLYIALIELNDDNERILSFPYYREEGYELLGNSQRKFGHGLTEYVINAGKPMLLTGDDLVKLKKEKKVDITGKVPETWLGVPLRVQSELIGLIAIQSYDHKSFYTSRDLKLLDFASSQIAMSIDMVKTQEKLKAQTAKLNSIIESSSHLIWTINRDLELTSFNQNYFDAIINNYDVMPDVQEGGSNTAQAFDKFWAAKYAEAFEGKQLNFEIKLKDKDHNDVWKEIHLNPIYLDGGRIEEVSGIANDITEKKQSEQALRESEEKFRKIYESFQDIYFRCDKNGIIDMVSPSVEVLTGYKPEDIIGKNIAHYYKNEQKINELLRKTVREQQISNFELTIYTKSGTPIECLCNLSLITNQDDQPTYFEGVVRDVTKLKLTTKELIKAKDLAEASLMVKEQFLANMSHEIRTPLNGIIGVIDLLEQTNLHKEQQSYLKTIKASSETLMGILNDILDLSKIEAGKMQLRPEPISPRQLIKKLESLFASRAATELIKIKFHLSKNIPEVIEADEMRLVQVISNLIANSIKFTHRGGSIDVGFEVKSVNGDDLLIRVEVRDSGIGIKKEDIKKLFTNFNQLDNSTTKAYGGTGLGLSISKQLVEMMGGEINVYSNPGFGSTFWFSFKAKKSDKEVVNKATEPNLQASLHQFTDVTPNILVVDDNLVNRDVAGEILKKCGCKVDLASNGIEAVYKARNKNFDIIFMDIQMPEMDGIEANKQIKKLKKKKAPWVVAMTAYSMEEDKQRILDAGLDDYMAKPIRANQLIGKVQQKILGTEPQQEVETPVNTAFEIVNRETIAQLQKYGGPDMVFNALKEFEEEAEKLLADCDKAAEKEDFQSMKKHLHTLKGTAGTIGVEQVAEKARVIEAKLKKEEYSTIKEDLLQLNNNFVEFKKNFTNIISHY